MSDKFLTKLISEMAKLRIRIDSIPNHPLRDFLEIEFIDKRKELMNATPIEHLHKIDEMIQEEIKRQERNGKTDQTIH